MKRFREVPVVRRDAIVTKACAGDPRDRYQTAGEMHADLALLQQGKSIRKRRDLRRALRICSRMAVALAALSLIVFLSHAFVRDSRKMVNPLTTQHQIDNASYWMTDFHPRRFDVSPDGNQIVFTGQAPSYRGLSLWDKATKICRKLDIPEAAKWQFMSPRWSPDGRLIALAAMRDEPPDAAKAKPFNALFILDPTTGHLTQLGEEREGFEGPLRVCWGPGDDTLTLVRDGQGYFVTLDGQVNRWAEFNVPLLGHLGGYSPDDRWLIFDAWVSDTAVGRSERDVWIMPVTGGAARRLTFEEGLDAFPAWAPDGRTIYYVSASDTGDRSTWNLWRRRIHLKTGYPRDDPEQITFDQMQRVYHPKVVAGGHALVYVTSRNEYRIWVGENGGYANGQEGPIGDSPVLSPNGDTIYYIGSTPKQIGVFAYSRLSGAVRRVTELVPIGELGIGAPYDLSPDGHTLVFLSENEQGKGIIRVRVGDGAATLIREVHVPETTIPRWSPDGRQIAYAELGGLYVIDREGGVRQELARIYRWVSVDWSPDGERLGGIGYASREAFEKKDPDSNNDQETNAVFVYAFADKTFKRLTPPEERYREGAVWHPDSQRMTYMYYGPGPYGAELRFAYVDGRPTTRMLDQEDHWDYLGRWAPEGTKYFFCSYPDAHDHEDIHVFDLATGEIEHGLWRGQLPTWSRDGKAMAWTRMSTQREFVWMEWGPASDESPRQGISL